MTGILNVKYVGMRHRFVKTSGTLYLIVWSKAIVCCFKNSKDIVIDLHIFFTIGCNLDKNV